MTEPTTSQDAPANDPPSARPTGWRRRWQACRRGGRRAFGLVVLLFALYAGLLLVGLYPVNQNFVADENGVEIFIFSGPFHSDVILPLTTEEFDWRPCFDGSDFLADVSQASHAAIGWGDEGFYLHTPTWDDLKFSTAAKALLIPSTTVMHVSMVGQPQESDAVRSVKISPEQYRAMVEFVRQSFRTNAAGSYQKIEGFSYGQHDAFYQANDSYHLFRTCNCWVGEAMQAGGIKTGWFTPLPKTVFWHLPKPE